MTPEEIHQRLCNVGSDDSFTLNNMKVLCELAKKLPENPVIVETGTLAGRSACAWALATNGTVYTIDIEDRLGMVNENIQKAGLVGKVIPLVADSAKIPWDRKVDCVFIDDDHSYEHTQKNIKKWMPYAKRMICGHDYTTQFPQVMNAVNDFFGTLAVNLDGIWVVVK